MEEEFELPVIYNGEQRLFKTRLKLYGYTHKFHLEMDGQVIVFEPDEKKNYCVAPGHKNLTGLKKIDKELLNAIAKTLEEIINWPGQQ